MCPTSGDLPNVVLVVMDCVRADEFPPKTHDGSPLPGFERLARESVVFDRAVAPSPWTLPSHASLFTGLYPWEHGLHGRGDHRLDPQIPTLAELLQRRGYRTMCFASNSHITESSGLTRGFSRAWRADPMDLYLRFGTSHPSPENDSAPPPSEGQRFRLPGDSRYGEWTRSLLSRFLENPPLAWDGANRLGRGLVGGRRTAHGDVSPWIEPMFEKTLSASLDAPFFAFFNFLDAHEPYPVESCDGNPLGWLRAGLVPQSRRRWVAGAWRPTPAELATLRELYRHAIARLDRRVSRVVSTLERYGAWDNTLLILTSDHGQAFGEAGALFHEFSLHESVTRVPLWVRYPQGADGRKRARGWASLVDIAPTVASQIGAAVPWSNLGRDLTPLIESDRPDPVYTSAEGFLWNSGPRLGPSRRSELDRIQVAAYFDSSRFDLDASTGKLSERHGVPGDGSQPRLSLDQRSELSRFLTDAAGRIRDAAYVPPTDRVAERMKAWGY